MRTAPPVVTAPSFTSNTVVLIGARGLFCRSSSQLIGSIVLQEAPSGQQSTVVLAASQMQWEPFLQQRLGRSAEAEPQSKKLLAQAMVMVLICHSLGYKMRADNQQR